MSGNKVKLMMESSCEINVKIKQGNAIKLYKIA